MNACPCCGVLWPAHVGGTCPGCRVALVTPPPDPPRLPPTGTGPVWPAPFARRPRPVQTTMFD